METTVQERRAPFTSVVRTANTPAPAYKEGEPTAVAPPEGATRVKRRAHRGRRKSKAAKAAVAAVAEATPAVPAAPATPLLRQSQHDTPAVPPSDMALTRADPTVPTLLSYYPQHYPIALTTLAPTTYPAPSHEPLARSTTTTATPPRGPYHHQGYPEMPHHTLPSPTPLQRRATADREQHSPSPLPFRLSLRGPPTTRPEPSLVHALYGAAVAPILAQRVYRHDPYAGAAQQHDMPPVQARVAAPDGRPRCKYTASHFPFIVCARLRWASVRLRAAFAPSPRSYILVRYNDRGDTDIARVVNVTEAFPSIPAPVPGEDAVPMDGVVLRMATASEAQSMLNGAHRAEEVRLHDATIAFLAARRAHIEGKNPHLGSGDAADGGPVLGSAALRRTNTKLHALVTHMEVVDVFLTRDQKVITVSFRYPRGNGFVDFRALLPGMFARFNKRVWLVRVDAADASAHAMPFSDGDLAAMG